MLCTRGQYISSVINHSPENNPFSYTVSEANSLLALALFILLEFSFIFRNKYYFFLECFFCNTLFIDNFTQILHLTMEDISFVGVSVKSNGLLLFCQYEWKGSVRRYGVGTERSCINTTLFPTPISLHLTLT